MRNTGQIEFGDPPPQWDFGTQDPTNKVIRQRLGFPQEGLPPSNHYSPRKLGPIPRFCIVPALFLESSGWWNPCLQESHPLFYGEVTDPEVKRAKAMVKLLLYLGIPYYFFLKFSCFFPEVTLSQGKPPPPPGFLVHAHFGRRMSRAVPNLRHPPMPRLCKSSSLSCRRNSGGAFGCVAACLFGWHHRFRELPLGWSSWPTYPEMKPND